MCRSVLTFCAALLLCVSFVRADELQVLRDGGAVGPDLAAWRASHGPRETVRVIVQMDSRVGVQLFAAERASAPVLIRALHARVSASQPAVEQRLRERWGAVNLRSLWIINALAAEVRGDVVDSIAALPGVASVELDHQLQAIDPDESTRPSNPPRDAMPTAVTTGPWTSEHLVRVRVPELWAAGLAGQGVVIGSIDSGFDPTHPAIAGKWRGGTNSWLDLVGGATTPYDDNGHGTHTIGTMVGGDGAGPFPNDIGIAYGATFIAAKTSDSNSQGYESWRVAAAQWMLDPDGIPDTNDFPTVICNSYGSPLDPYGLASLDAVMQMLRAAGIVPVFCAGNSGSVQGSIWGPASRAAEIAVGATGSNDMVTLYSSRGPSPVGNGFPALGRKPDLAAPGDSIVSSEPGGGYAAWSGTSMAAPHVCGAIALLQSGNAALTPDDIYDALITSATDYGVPGFDYAFGYGLLDAYAAARQANALPSSVIDPPGSLIAAASGDAVSLTWDAARSSGLLRYEVLRSTAPHDPGRVVVGTTTSTAYVDTVATGPYWYTVRAVTGAGTSELSNEAHASPGVPVLSTEYGVLPRRGYWPAAEYGSSYGLVTGDFNGDGIADIAVPVVAIDAYSEVGYLSVLLGHGSSGMGDGTFAPAAYISTSLGPLFGIATADLNGDGILDLVVLPSSGSNVFVLPGTGQAGVGNGGFGPAVSVPCGATPWRLAITDLNGDGALDMAIACYDQSAVSILLGNQTNGIADGTFMTGASVPCATHPVNVLAEDLNGDGVSDLVVASAAGPVSVFLGNLSGGVPTGTYTAAATCAVIGTLGQGGIEFADVNGDGIRDLVAPTSSGLAVLLGNADGSFQPATLSPGTSTRVVTIGDLNGDGVPDAVVRLHRRGLRSAIRFGLGRASGGGVWFGPELLIQELYDYNGTTSNVVADFNGDGTPDIALATVGMSTIAVALNPTSTMLSTAVTIAGPPAESALIAGQPLIVRWTKGAGITAVNLAISRDGGVHWQTIASNCPGTSAKWIVTGPFTAQARLKVFDPAVPARSATSETFAIVLPWQVAVGPAAALTYSLGTVRPNPFTSLTTIAFAIAQRQRVSIAVFDVAGRRVRALVQEPLEAGRYDLQWDGTDDHGRATGAGLYFCRMEAGTFRSTRRLVLVR